VPPVNAPAPHAAEGIAYFAVDGAEGDYFECGPYRARLSTTACAKRWRGAQVAMDAAAERLEKCRSCAIGAAHAGQRQIYRSPIYAASICRRCGNGTTRMIRGELCISCYNRQREFKVGRDRKGMVPQFRFDRRAIGVILEPGTANERCVKVAEDFTASREELITGCLRVIVGEAAFGRARGTGPVLSVAELAAMFGAAPPKVVCGPDLRRRRPDRRNRAAGTNARQVAA
jgi:hypothetical protein